jgi:hypothetical protein
MSDRKSVECVSNNWDLFVGAFKIIVIPQNIITKKKFESCMSKVGVFGIEMTYIQFWDVRSVGRGGIAADFM